MTKVKLVVADNISLSREGTIHRAGDTFEAERDDEIQRWVELGYVQEVKRHKAKKRKA